MTAAELFEVVRPLMGTRFQPGDVAYDHDYPEWWNPVKVDGLSVDHAELIWTGWLIERIHKEDQDMAVLAGVLSHANGTPLLTELVSAAVAVLAREGEK